jgi:hypothetical protein
MGGFRWPGARDEEPRREHWTDDEVRALEAELSQALGRCTNAVGRRFTERQALRLRRWLAALEQALEELT